MRPPVTQAAAHPHEETSDAIEDAKPVIKSVPKKKTGSALTRLKKNFTEDEHGRGGRLRRRKMRLVVDKDLCDPGAFEDDFELVLESCSSADELDALKEASDNPGSMPFLLARNAIRTCDGEPVGYGDGSRELLWEALGPAGRSLILRKFNEFCGNFNAEALKKADSSTAIIV